MKRKSLLNNVRELDFLISRLQKDESRCRNGQFIDVWRDIGGIIGDLEKSKRNLIADAEKNEVEDEK